MPVINMRSSAHKIKGQGVGSCYEEQVRLVTEGLPSEYTIYVNKNKPCDITHYHTVNFDYYLHRLIHRRRTTGIGYVHFLPDTLEDSLELPFLAKTVFNKYLLFFYNSMDFLVTVNPAIIQKLYAYGVKRPKIIYIPNYVSTLKFCEQKSGYIATVKKKYQIPQDKFVVMGAGQLQTRKGISDFVETAKLLPDIQFIWAGGFSFGKISDGYKNIKQIRNDPPGNVKFLGIIDRERMSDIYNMADIFFLPSFDELFPMSILEAMCCRKPVLLRDINVYKDILFENYLKADTPENFAAQIILLRNDESLLEYWREKSWTCREIYSEEHVIKKWQSLYEEAYNWTKFKSMLKFKRNRTRA